MNLLDYPVMVYPFLLILCRDRLITLQCSMISMDNFCKKIINSASREGTYLDITKQAKAMELVRKGLVKA